MNTNVLLFVASASLCLCSCDASVDDKPPAPAETSNKPNYDALVECGAATCKGSAQRIEGGTPFSMYGMACIVEAMRDRTPGVYSVKLNHTWSNGLEDADYLMVIGTAGDATMGVHHYSGWDSTESELWDPTKRCSLAAPNFFDACLTAVQMGEGPDATPEAWACVFPESATTTLELPWFASCIEQAPTCD